MLKVISVGLAVFTLLLGAVALMPGERGVHAGFPNCTDGLDGSPADGLIDSADPLCASATPTETATPSATATAAPTSTAEAGSASPTATRALTPSAVPGTGGEPDSTTSLLLIFALGAGVVAGAAGLAGIAVMRRS